MTSNEIEWRLISLSDVDLHQTKQNQNQAGTMLPPRNRFQTCFVDFFPFLRKFLGGRDAQLQTSSPAKRTTSNVFEVWQKKKFSRIRRQRVASSFHFLPYPSGQKKSFFCWNCCLFLKKRNNWSSSGWITLRKFLYSHSDFSFYASLLLLQLFVRSLHRLPRNNLSTLVGLCLFDLVVVLVKWFDGPLCKF